MKKIKDTLKNKKVWLILSIIYLLVALIFVFTDAFNIQNIKQTFSEPFLEPKYPRLDKKDYDKRIYMLAGYSTTSYAALLNGATTSTSTKISLWPVKTVYPLDGAILPFKRIVAYYGNLLSTGMGVLGEYPEDIMLAKLDAEVKKWTAADPETPAIPALHYIVVTAQGKPGVEGKYRLRMPDTEIEKVLKMAEKINALVFLDVQVGQSTIQAELPLLKKYLEMPNVHLAMDPEFSMKNGALPGKVVGRYDAVEINYAIDFLRDIVKEKDLSPKILIIHRYIQEMVTNYNLIKTSPEVQIVMDMDGWGQKSNKIASYMNYIVKEPVQFTGFKLFYKNDLWKPSKAMMTPAEVLELKPKPVYIQYQ